MTKRKSKARDFEKFPVTEAEKLELIAHRNRLMRRAARYAKREQFNKLARVHNTERGISP